MYGDSPRSRDVYTITLVTFRIERAGGGGDASRDACRRKAQSAGQYCLLRLPLRAKWHYGSFVLSYGVARRRRDGICDEKIRVAQFWYRAMRMPVSIWACRKHGDASLSGVNTLK